MARPERNNVDYFPFYCEDGNKMFYIEETYGNDGFATFIKLLRELAKTNYHYLDLSKPSTLMFLSAKCKVSKEVLESIINDLVDLGKFDGALWNENRIIWCQDFVDSVQDAYSKRKNKCISYYGLLELLHSLGIRKLDKSDNKAPVKPQSIVEYSKEEEIKEDNIDNSEFVFSLSNSPVWIENICISKKITEIQCKEKLKEFEKHLIITLDQKKNKKMFVEHFSNWLEKNKTITENKNKSNWISQA